VSLPCYNCKQQQPTSNKVCWFG